MSQPARIGPATPASPMTGPNGMKALPSWSGGKATFTMARPCGIITAPKRPCRMRAPMSQPAPGASPQASDASVKPAMHTRNIRRRPSRSPRRPLVTRPRAKAAV